MVSPALETTDEPPTNGQKRLSVTLGGRRVSRQPMGIILRASAESLEEDPLPSAGKKDIRDNILFFWKYASKNVPILLDDAIFASKVTL